MDKRGVSQLIAWVLLFGLTITLAALVGNWAIKQAKEFDPEKTVASDLYCDNVGVIVDGVNCPILTIKNKGSFNLHSVLVRVTDSSGATKNYDEIITPALPPDSISTYDITFNCPVLGPVTEIDILPRVKQGNEEITCDRMSYIIKGEALGNCC